MVKRYLRIRQRDPKRFIKSSFKIKDRGTKGRGRNVIPKLRKGTLGIKFSQSTSSLKRTLKRKAMQLGEKRVAGKLRAISLLNKRVNKPLSRKAGNLASWISGAFKGKKYVGAGKGYYKRR